jgi:hypothetical protein
VQVSLNGIWYLLEADPQLDKGCEAETRDSWFGDGMKPSRSQYVYASAWPWVLTIWGLPLACSLGVGIGSGETDFMSVLPHTLWGALIGFIAAAFFIGPTQRRRGEMNGPFRVGDMARILVKPHRDRVARVCEVWPELQTARLEVGQETRSFGGDTFGWHELVLERDAEPPVAADAPQASRR